MNGSSATSNSVFKTLLSKIKFKVVNNEELGQQLEGNDLHKMLNFRLIIEMNNFKSK
jgi:hypothetical protein